MSDLGAAIPSFRVTKAMGTGITVNFTGPLHAVPPPHARRVRMNDKRVNRIYRVVALSCIQQCKPQQNAYIECDNRTVWHERLGQYLFGTIVEVREHATRWLTTPPLHLPRLLVDLLGKSGGAFDKVALSGGPYEPDSTTKIHG